MTCLILASASLAACSSASAPQPSQSAGGCDVNDVVVSDSGEVSSSEECQFPGETLRVAAYAGAMTEALQEGVGSLFEEATGATIEWVGTDNATAISQILASRGAEPPIDVVSAMTTDGVVSLVQAGALAEIPDITHLEDMPAQAIAVEGYGPGFYYYPTGLCIRADKFADAGIDPAEGIEVFTDPALAGVVGFPTAGISQWDLTMPAFAAHFGVSADEPDDVVEWLSSIDGLKLWASSSELDQMLLDGEIWASPYSDGRCNALADQGAPVEYVGLNLDIDGETYDAVGATVGAYIVANTPNPELAAIYASLVNTPEGILPYLRDRAFYVPTNPHTAEILAEALPEKADLLDIDVESLYQADYETFLPSRQDWLSAWNRAFQG